MTSTLPLSRPTRASLVAGRLLTGLAAGFLSLDGATKIVAPDPVVRACREMGIDGGLIRPLGVLLLALVVLHLVRRTSALGAVGLVGYLGGATALHLVRGDGAFPVLFPVAIGAMVLAGLLLRRPGMMEALR